MPPPPLMVSGGTWISSHPGESKCSLKPMFTYFQGVLHLHFFCSTFRVVEANTFSLRPRISNLTSVRKCIPTNQLYSFTRAGITKCHKLGDFRLMEISCLTVPEARSLKSRCGQGHVPSETGLPPVLLASGSEQRSAAVWSVDTSLRSSVFMWLSSLHACLSLSRFPVKGQGIGIMPTLSTSSAKILFPCKVTF